MHYVKLTLEWLKEFENQVKRNDIELPDINNRKLSKTKVAQQNDIYERQQTTPTRLCCITESVK